MEYFLENDYLKVTVTTFGAQVKSPRICLRCFKAIHLAQFYANKDSSIHILGKRGCR